MNRVITFGEILMRLSPPNGLRFSQANSLDLCFGGGEFNVAVSLANFGIDTGFVTCLPDNDLGKRALMEIRKHNVSCRNILFSGNRLGIYFLEEGSGTRAGKVVYDRADSAIANIEPGQMDWQEIFKEAAVFHWSGITPAISPAAAAVCLEALQAAREAGLMITCDLNYRAKLWKYGKAPRDIMPRLLQYCDVILGDIDTALFMLGREAQNPDYKAFDSLGGHYDSIFESCPNLKQMATTIRYSLHKDHQQIGGILYDKKKLYHAPVQDVVPVLDRIGTGDAFMGGLLYGMLDETFDAQKTLDFAVASCRLKHTIKGDLNAATVEEIQRLLDGDVSGKVDR